MLKRVEHLPCEERQNELEPIGLWKRWLTWAYKCISVLEYECSPFRTEELQGIRPGEQVVGSKRAKGGSPQNTELWSETPCSRTCWMLRIYMTSKRKLRGKITEGKSTRCYHCSSGNLWAISCWRSRGSSKEASLPTFPGFTLSIRPQPVQKAFSVHFTQSWI